MAGHREYIPAQVLESGRYMVVEWNQLVPEQCPQCCQDIVNMEFRNIHLARWVQYLMIGSVRLGWVFFMVWEGGVD